MKNSRRITLKQLYAICNMLRLFYCRCYFNKHHFCNCISFTVALHFTLHNNDVSLYRSQSSAFHLSFLSHGMLVLLMAFCAETFILITQFSDVDIYIRNNRFKTLPKLLSLFHCCSEAG